MKDLGTCSISKRDAGFNFKVNSVREFDICHYCVLEFIEERHSSRIPFTLRAQAQDTTLPFASYGLMPWPMCELRQYVRYRLSGLAVLQSLADHGNSKHSY